MHHAHNENVQLHWASGPNLGLLLIEAAGFVDAHADEGYLEVHSHLDFETGDYCVNVYLYA